MGYMINMDNQGMSETHTSMESNIISGEIKGYLISGIVYSDSRMVISIPTKKEVPLELIESIEYPDEINDVRYYNGKIDFLTNILNFNVCENEDCFEQLIDLLREANIESDSDYVENRIEESHNFWLKALGVFVIDVILGIFIAMLIFEFQLGQTVGSPDGSFYIHYYVPVFIGFYPIMVQMFNEKLYTRFSMVNHYNNESEYRYLLTTTVFMLVSVLISQVYFIVLNGVKILEMPTNIALAEFWFLIKFFFTVDLDVSMMFIMNVIFLIIGLLLILSKNIPHALNLNKIIKHKK